MNEPGKIDRLIINSPYAEPGAHWSYDRQNRTFRREPGRRSAGYVVASESAKGVDDPGRFVEIPLVNQIRPRVKAWREGHQTGRPWDGVTGMTRRLLEHWSDPAASDARRFFFCQLEAVETLIWLAEGPESERVGLQIPGDGGAFRRLCAKMATGTGKTLVMSMVLAWQLLNKAAYPQDARYSKHALVVAPGLTVKNRLEVLKPSAEGNYYEAFGIIPPGSGLMDKLRQGKVKVINWHKLNWESEERIKKRRSVDKRGAMSDEAYARDVLEELKNARNLLVLNDEAHHAWRVPAGEKPKGVSKEEIEEAAKWIGGLDRIHRTRGIMGCYDFSATPFVPSGRTSSEEALFGWIVSDFGLNDAIESGLVKTPRVVIRDDAVPDAKTYKSRLYHIYNDPEVKDDLNRKAEEADTLPDLVRNAYYLLGYDWRETAKDWQAARVAVPPVMITVCNRTETAARVRFAFERKKIPLDELCEPDRLLHIDSKVLGEAEAQDEAAGEAEPKGASEGEAEGEEAAPKETKKQRAERLRRTVDSVGQVGKEGERIHNVISVGMLSEGWDAKTVTHVMGLRAFTSQLLCEQVVGRGLRRTAYEVGEDGLFKPEYVNVFGVPFSFLPHESQEGVRPEPLPPPLEVKALPERAASFEISWPNIIRVDHSFRERLAIDWAKVEPLELNAAETAQIAEIAPVVEGKPDSSKVSVIDLEKLAADRRMQRVIFETARDVFDEMGSRWKGSKAGLIAQLVGLAEGFMRSEKIVIKPELFNLEESRRRILLSLNMAKVVQHVLGAIKQENSERLEPVFDGERAIRSTGDMGSWFTRKPAEKTKRSHIEYCVFDSAWESCEAYALDHDPNVEAWAKNDHLGFEVVYVYRGVVHKYRPDFLIRLKGGGMLVLEVKGQDTDEDHHKRKALAEWVKAVNEHGGFGHWAAAVSFNPSDVRDILKRQSNLEQRESGSDGAE